MERAGRDLIGSKVIPPPQSKDPSMNTRHKTTAISILAASGLALSLTAAPALFAQDGDELPGAPDPARVIAGTYTADPAHSLVEFEVNHFGFNEYFGIFGDVSGTLEIDPDNLESAKVDVIIPIVSVTTASADTPLKGLHILVAAYHQLLNTHPDL